jgi:opacity protein-like surface antigen
MMRIGPKKIIFWLFAFLLCSSVRPCLAGYETPSRPVKIRASTLAGYDNNPQLNADRKGDFFSIASASISYKNALNGKTRLRLAYDMFNVNYFEVTDENILYQAAGAGLDFEIRPGTALETDYDFRYAWFPNEELASSLGQEVRGGVRQALSDNVELRAGVSYSTKDYDERFNRESSGILSSSEERGDNRYEIDTELGFRISRDLYLRAGFAYYLNDSDDQFHDYYDYDSYRIHTSVRWRPCPVRLPKLHLTGRFSYENRDYNSRPLVDDAHTFESADIYTAAAGCYYQLHRNISLGVDYSYRQKNSNEPSQSYSSSISTIGLHYSF